MLLASMSDAVDRIAQLCWARYDSGQSARPPADPVDRCIAALLRRCGATDVAAQTSSACVQAESESELEREEQQRRFLSACSHETYTLILISSM